MPIVYAAVDATEIDLNNVVDETTGVRYLGPARRRDDGCWTALADVGGALCIVEVNVRPSTLPRTTLDVADPAALGGGSQ